MAFMDHGLPARVAGGILSEAHVTWKFLPDGGDGRDSIRFTWDIGHKVTAMRSDGQLLDEWLVGDAEKATTSRRTVENSIRKFLDGRAIQGSSDAHEIAGLNLSGRDLSAYGIA